MATTDDDLADAFERVRYWLQHDREPTTEYVTADEISADLDIGVGAVEQALGVLEQEHPVNVQREYDPEEGVRWKIGV